MNSEFGKGLTYCLGLFLCHSERDYMKETDRIINNIGLWFNGAGDHLFELQIPISLPFDIRVRLKEFKDKVITWRCSEPTKENKEWAIREAKDLLRLLDEHIGIKTSKGDWE